MQHTNRKQTMGLFMCFHYSGRIRRLGKTEYMSLAFIHPVVDEVHPIFSLSSQVFLMCICNIFCRNFTRTEVMYVEEKILPIVSSSFRAVCNFKNIVRQQTMRILMRQSDRSCIR